MGGVDHILIFSVYQIAPRHSPRIPPSEFSFTRCTSRNFAPEERVMLIDCSVANTRFLASSCVE